MKFHSHGRQYEVDKYGVIVQTDHRPYAYTPQYSAVYDTPDYRKQSDFLQALRLGFACAAHGKPIRSILDVGYGNGAFLDHAANLIPTTYGYDITGVELERSYQVPEIIKADVITMWDVLEHFPDIQFVETLPCETLVVSLPYCHMITQGVEWFNDVYKHRKPDEHIRHFNEYSLELQLLALGWKKVAVSNHEDMVRKSAHGLQNILSMAFKKLYV